MPDASWLPVELQGCTTMLLGSGYHLLHHHRSIPFHHLAACLQLELHDLSWYLRHAGTLLHVLCSLLPQYYQHHHVGSQSLVQLGTTEEAVKAKKNVRNVDKSGMQFSLTLGMPLVAVAEVFGADGAPKCELDG